MSVLMTMQIRAEAAKLEQQDTAEMNAIVDKAKEQGLISHHFYAKGDNDVMVVDEWPDEATFQRFFDSAPEIGEVMQRAGAGAPEITFWRHLDVGDDYPS